MQSILHGRRLLSNTLRITHLFADPAGHTVHYTLLFGLGPVDGEGGALTQRAGYGDVTALAAHDALH